MRILILLGFLICAQFTFAGPPAPASAADQAANLRATYEVVAKIKAAKTLKEKLERLRQFEKKIAAAQASAQKKALRVKPGPREAAVRASELEMIYWSLAFERAFETVLKPDFQNEAAVRAQVCEEVPKDIKFGEQPASGETYDLSEYRKLAISLVQAICTDGHGT